jgi:hypothetical protein
MKPESSDTRAAEITSALTPAYQNASRLKITKAEAKIKFDRFAEV